MSIIIRFCLLACAFFTLVVNGAPSGATTLQSRSSKTASDKLVFCHFIVGYFLSLLATMAELMTSRWE